MRTHSLGGNAAHMSQDLLGAREEGTPDAGCLGGLANGVALNTRGYRAMVDIRDKMCALMEATEHPLAPQVFQDAYAAVQRLGPIMVGVGDLAQGQIKTNQYMTTMLGAWTEEELNRVSATPEFIVALSGMLCASLEAYAKGFGQGQIEGGVS